MTNLYLYLLFGLYQLGAFINNLQFLIGATVLGLFIYGAAIRISKMKNLIGISNNVVNKVKTDKLFIEEVQNLKANLMEVDGESMTTSFENTTFDGAGFVMVKKVVSMDELHKAEPGRKIIPGSTVNGRKAILRTKKQ